MIYFTLITLPKITFYLMSLYLLLSLFVLFSIQRLKLKNNNKLKFYKIVLVYGKKILKNTTPVLFSLTLLYVITSVSNNLKLGPNAIYFSGLITIVLMMVYFLKKCIINLKKME